jgi:hypothetical protein
VVVGKADLRTEDADGPAVEADGDETVYEGVLLPDAVAMSSTASCQLSSSRSHEGIEQPLLRLGRPRPKKGLRFAAGYLIAIGLMMACTAPVIRDGPSVNRNSHA